MPKVERTEGGRYIISGAHVIDGLLAERKRAAHERWLREPEGCIVERTPREDDEGEGDENRRV